MVATHFKGAVKGSGINMSRKNQKNRRQKLRQVEKRTDEIADKRWLSKLLGRPV